MSRDHFEGARVWITGASRGIGAALAREFAGRGAFVGLSARSEAELAALVKELPPARAWALPLDVTSREANVRVVDELVAHWGEVDVVILNAGTCEYVDVNAFDSGAFRRMMETNFMGVVYGLEAALPALRASTRPHLAAVGSLAGYHGLPRAEAYGASKAALLNLLQSLRLDLQREGIPVTAILPGFVDTSLTARNDFPMPHLMDAGEAARRIVNGLARRKPVVRFPWQLAHPLWLASVLPERLVNRILSTVVQT